MPADDVVPAAKASPGRVLIFDAETEPYQSAIAILRESGFDILLCEDRADGMETLKQYKPTVVIADVNYALGAGSDLLPNLRKYDATLPVIVSAKNTDLKLYLRCLEAGSHTLLRKPVEDWRLLHACITSIRAHHQDRALRNAVNLVMYQSADLHDHYPEGATDEMKAAVRKLFADRWDVKTYLKKSA